jgi:hypothetical protein
MVFLDNSPFFSEVRYVGLPLPQPFFEEGFQGGYRQRSGSHRPGEYPIWVEASHRRTGVFLGATLSETPPILRYGRSRRGKGGENYLILGGESPLFFCGKFFTPILSCLTLGKMWISLSVYLYISIYVYLFTPLLI